MFDKIGKALKEAKESIIEKIVEVPTIKATMMGPRAVGKTSVMTSIFSDSRENIAGTELYFQPIIECEVKLTNKRLELQNVITTAKDPNAGGTTASNKEEKFEFELGLKGQKKSFGIELRDFPGEYIKDHPNEVNKFIDESLVIIVAIDTPYLMEENGQYNEEKNEVSRVTNFFKNHSKELKDKLVLMVPLKCERYFHDKRIDEVTSAVGRAYSELIDFCKAHNIACVISPIQTMGDVEFDCMVDNDNPMISLTKLSRFRFASDKPKYRPLFCIQPLYYLLTYTANYFNWEKSQPRSFVKRLQASLSSLFMNDSKLLYEIDKMSPKIITSGNGYSIVHNNNILKIK